MRRLTVVAVVLALASALAHDAAARSPAPAPKPIAPLRKSRPVRPKPAPSPPGRSKNTSLKSRLGIAIAQGLLESKSEDDRVRGLERLGAVAMPAAIELLAKSLEPGNAARSFAERVTAVRALARHSDVSMARQALARAMSSAGRGDDEGETLVRDIAALALARSGRRDALEILGKALRQQGPIAVSAGAALLAHPPKDIGPIVAARGAATVTLVEVLERLGDQRSFELLRSIVRHGSAEVKGRAALALTRLGDFETVALAKQWLATEKDSTLLALATRILATARDEAASEHIARLLRDEKTSGTGVELALAAPGPALFAPLAELADSSDATSVPRLLGAMGRTGSPDAARYLGKKLGSAEHAHAAAYALALAPGPDAARAIEAALGAAATRRMAARAAVIRELATGEHVSGLGAALETLLASSVPADRAAGAWGQAARDPARAITLLSHSDRVVVCAAARAALSPEVAPTAAERLAKEKDPVVRTALAIALAREPSARLVPTKLLTELALGGGPAAPIAAKALAARDERATIDLLLGSSDPLVRTHVALGLSDNRDPAVVGLLSRRFKFETDASVRYAMVVALSRRSETSRRVTLREAADLDGDTRVRQAARRALSGSRLPALPRGTGTLWLSLVASQKGGAVSQEAMIGMPSGLSLPVVADPDGAVTLSRLPSGPLSLRLAARATEDKAQGP